MKPQRIAVIGTGVIGASWASLFAAAGHDVIVHDPAPGAAERLEAYMANAWPALEKLGVAKVPVPPRLAFAPDIAGAVDGATFVQENVPERIELKLETFRAIEPVLAADAIVASSASGLMVKQMQAGWKNPSRFLLAHPFNPPHLIPLAELLGNEHTAEETLARAEAFYASCDKVTIRVHKEVPGHIANRLQAALWREAINLVMQGVGTVEDVDKAIWAGPGLRWAAMGPHMLFNLGAASGGLPEFCQRYADSFHGWWDSMDDARLDSTVIAGLADGVEREQQGRSLSQLMEERDALIVAMRQATRDIRTVS